MHFVHRGGFVSPATRNNRINGKDRLRDIDKQPCVKNAYRRGVKQAFSGRESLFDDKYRFGNESPRFRLNDAKM